MEKLCIHYGTKLGTIPGGGDEYVYYDFPAPCVLADPAVEQRLRELGFGYRAKYIQATAHMIAHTKPSGWLSTLRTKPYAEAKECLLELSGVGPKVADCVVYLSYDEADVVPVLLGSALCCAGGYACMADCCARLQVSIEGEKSRQYDEGCI